MRVAVVTPYYREALEVLHQCHESVARQSHASVHVMVADGHPVRPLDHWDIEHIRLPSAHGDAGDTARAIGALHAVGLGFDAIAFLDADNWYREDHIAGLVALHQATGAAFVSSSRLLCRLDGSIMGPCPNTDPAKFIDTSCMMFTRPMFQTLALWASMPDWAHVVGDRVMLHEIRQAGYASAHSPEHSVYYRCGKAGAYRQLGETPPDGVEPPPDYGAAFARWIEMGYPPLT